MTIPTPRYQIGDTVYCADVRSTTCEYDCPDCLGTKLWKLTTPAGGEISVDCQRCSGHGLTFRGSSKTLPSLIYQIYVAAVRTLTIGSVRIDTSSDRPVEYMAVETGVGSGSVYDERRLFSTEHEARIASQAEADAKNAEQAELPHAMRVEHFSNLTLHQAALGLTWESVYAAWDQARAYRDVIDAIREDEKAMKALGEDHAYALDEVVETKSWVRKHPLELLIDACIARDDAAIAAALDALPRPMPKAEDSRLQETAVNPKLETHT